MGFCIKYDHEKQECVACINETGQQIKQLYWKIEVTDEYGNTTKIKREKVRKTRATAKAGR
jgi:hypothetical protein